VDRVRIKDVAAAAGVSSATVSRVMNDLASVDEELARRVRTAADRLGYRPNAVARSLRTQASSVWALIISDIENPFYTAVARGVEDIARAAGYSVLLCNADEDEYKEHQYLAVAQQEQAAGIIISPHSSRSSQEQLSRLRIPLVAIDRPAGVEADSVFVDSRSGAYQATRHLAESWEHVACITGPKDAYTAVERAAGYRSAIRDAGQARAIVSHVRFKASAGREAVARVLDANPETDALFVANAVLTLGCLEELRARGLVVGRDIGLVGFDDAPWAPLIDPPISVVAQPANEIGRAAARLLLERIAGDPDRPIESVVLSTRLVIRSSSLRASA